MTDCLSVRLGDQRVSDPPAESVAAKSRAIIEASGYIEPPFLIRR
jgi:hypothetical protein